MVIKKTLFFFTSDVCGVNNDFSEKLKKEENLYYACIICKNIFCISLALGFATERAVFFMKLCRRKYIKVFL